MSALLQACAAAVGGGDGLKAVRPAGALAAAVPRRFASAAGAAAPRPPPPAAPAPAPRVFSRSLHFAPRRPWLPLRRTPSAAGDERPPAAAAVTARPHPSPSPVDLMREWNGAGRFAQTVALFDALPREDALRPELAVEYVRALQAGPHGAGGGEAGGGGAGGFRREPGERGEAAATAGLRGRAAAFGRATAPGAGGVPAPASDFRPPEFRLRLDDSGMPLRVAVKGLGASALLVRDMVKYFLTVILCLSALSLVVEGAAQNLPKGFGLGGAAGGGAMKANVVIDAKTRFSDVKGCDEAKGELEEIVEYLKDPKKFTRLGARLPRGVLLTGPPGTGKTLLARAVAGEASVPFIQAGGSEFEEMFVGVGARRVRDLFAAARKNAPAILFIDEIDAVGSKRAHRENTSVRMTLNQLLVELDGFEQNEGLVVLCATNLPEALDSALTRPGRLDKTVVVPLPDLRGREEILKLYASRVVMDEAVDLHTLAQRTVGMSGADLFNVINIAAVRSSAAGRDAVDAAAIEEAFDRVVLGLERRSPLSEAERRMTAVHEGGHAVVAMHTRGADPLYKATIMPRGNALGVTWQLPRGDVYSHRLFELEGRLDVLMGGKAAELLVYGSSDVSAGCASDLRAATQLARQMTMAYGMGTTPQSHVPQTIDVDAYGALSPDLRKNVDDAVQRLLDESFERASAVVKSKNEELKLLADALCRYETLSSAEIALATEGRIDEIQEQRDRRAAEKAKDAGGFLEKIKQLKKNAASIVLSGDAGGEAANGAAAAAAGAGKTAPRPTTGTAATAPASTD